ncbi:hypothetical protein PTTG_28464 [Puccinia triticina 1-1 BBBD Race 1]|uniref:PSP1 C-terminal domain-containing protein n=1 Tax=Puccinia triticina (isolate 1-1 / race 1 (BBBD)) TaxID=630390 RepID=A0A180GBD3_PUCT1|nr:hypothetical protein PTTG_28464 [Puccinia triticina 1-1 BBBD Race 1]
MFRSPASEQANPLPPPSRTLPANIWAQPSQPAPSSCSGSDFDLGSPLLASTRHPAMLSRRCSHLSPAHSPTEPLGPIALGTDRHRRSLAPASPLSTPFAPASLPSNFFQPWHEPPPDERIGRPTARDIRHPAGAYRDPSVGSIGSPCSSSARSGIGLSNMSPFTGNSLLPPGGPVSFGGSLTTSHLDLGYRIHSRARDSSLGAIGSGRMAARSSVPATTPASGLGLASSSSSSSGSRILNSSSSNNNNTAEFGFVGSVGTDSWLTGGRSLSNDLDEDDEFAPPTKSGATSRRHSLSAFIGARSSFEPLPSSRTHPHTAFLLNDRKNNQRVPSAHSTSAADIPPQQNNPGEIFGPSSSAITDEDLCFSADFNSLNLDLDSQQSSQEPSDRLGFQFSNHYAHSQPSPFQPKPNHPPPDTLPAAAPPPPPPLNNMPWSAQLPPAPNPFGGPESFARKSSFSAGDPFSASAQASRIPQPPRGSRFPFSHARIRPPAPRLAQQPRRHHLQRQRPALRPPAPRPPAHQWRQQARALGPIPLRPRLFGCAVLLRRRNPLPPPSLDKPTLAPLPPDPTTRVPDDTQPTTPTVARLSPLLARARAGAQRALGARQGRAPPPAPAFLSPVHRRVQGGADGPVLCGWPGGPSRRPARPQGRPRHRRGRPRQRPRQGRPRPHLHRPGRRLPGPPAGAAPGPPPTAAAPPPPSPAGDIGGLPSTASSRLTKEIHPKKIFGRASAADVQALHLKTEEERKALSLCRAKALQRGLRMQVKDAEWQWDRRKLTFFFVADKRIDFRELVKDLFRTWKTRIWMCSVNP